MKVQQYFELPQLFVERMTNELGADAAGFFDSLEGQSPIAIRLNPRKKSKSDFPSDIPWASEGEYLNERPAFSQDPLFHLGAYYVQEPSSMMLEQIWNNISPSLPENPVVLDVCAAPGGKSTHLLSLMNGHGVLVANEVDPVRNKILLENLIKWGFSNVVATRSDTKFFPGLSRMFDVILVDAPCSGEGMFRKDMFARQQWSERLVQDCSFIQKGIISNLMKCLKSGGCLIYSTCTFSKEENEDIAEYLIQNFGGGMISLPGINDFGGVENRGVYHMYPHKVRGEGLSFFVWKNTSAVEIKEKKLKSFPSKSSKSFHVPKGVVYPESDILFEFEDEIYHSSKLKKEVLDKIHEQLRVSWIGGKIGKKYNEEIKLCHDAILSTDLKINDFSEIELDKEIALKIIKREQCSMDIPDGKYLGMYQGIPLTMVTVQKSRVSSLWPVEYRLRK